MAEQAAAAVTVTSTETHTINWSGIDLSKILTSGIGLLVIFAIFLFNMATSAIAIYESKKNNDDGPPLGFSVFTLIINLVIILFILYKLGSMFFSNFSIQRKN